MTMATTTLQRVAGSIATDNDADRIAILHEPCRQHIADRCSPAAPVPAIPLWATPFKLPGIKSYPGGKGSDGTVQRLINEIPPHRWYVEPFVGGGSIIRHKLPAPFGNTVVENDPSVFRTWLDQAPPWVEVVHGDGIVWLKESAPIPDRTFYFLDPPYLADTLKSGRVPYAHGMDYDQHVELLRLLNRYYCHPHSMVMICALPNQLYEKELSAWRTFQYQNKTRRGMQTEQVWMNYPKPKRLHDYRYLGDTYRDRERIRRKQRNKLKELEAMDPMERNAMIVAIRQAYP